MDWKQQTILILMGAFVSSMVIGGISEVIEDKLKKVSSEYYNSFEYKRCLVSENVEEEA